MQNADEFLKARSYFQLGILPTEQANPMTGDLSEWAATDLDRGIKALQLVDVTALRKTAALYPIAAEMRLACLATLKSGGRIFLCGCGATGRLALSLEYLWRREHSDSDQVISFMAGGDVALVHSLEGFEDYPERGARQLEELGFTSHDLLISSSEGGETPFVIGATERAAEIAERKPYFLYCNPTEILIKNIDRSKKIIENPRIEAREIFVGSMSLSGSTRMQASTVLMLIMGLALLTPAESEVEEKLKRWISFYEEMDLTLLRGFILKEAETYLEGHRTVYAADEFAITVMTDTTERAPTFNLTPFDNQLISQTEPSLSYVMLPKSYDVQSSWRALLARAPRPLDWPEASFKATGQYLVGFDFSQKALAFRKKIAPQSEHRVFAISRVEDDLCWSFQGIEKRIPLNSGHQLFQHLTLKMLMNIHSTLVMGRLKRYQGNFMTWVYPSNGKLVDRAARYSIWLLEREGIKNASYEEIVKIQFEVKKTLQSKESIVVKTAAKYKATHSS
jgi:N-acetylmuramic acid 6-phosphate etherase